MADVTHASLTGSDLHEPKGVSTASANQIYVANGAGSGVWTDPVSFINDSYCCVYLSPQNQSRTFTAGEVDTIVPFVLDYTTSVDCRNWTWNNTTKDLTYIGTTSIVSRLSATVSCALIGVATPTLKFYVQKYTGGTWVTNTFSLAARKFSSNDVGNLSIACLGTIAPGEKLRLAVESDSAEEFEFYNLNFSVFGFNVE